MAAIAPLSRSQVRRFSPEPALNTSRNHAAQSRVLGDDTDSDDEPPPALRFSKVTQALLADVAVPVSPSRDQKPEDAPSQLTRSTSVKESSLTTPSKAPELKIIRRTSPSGSSTNDFGRRTTPNRIVQIGGRNTGSAAKRSISVSGPFHHEIVRKRDPTPDSELKTPAHGPRPLRTVRPRAGSNASQDEPMNVAQGQSRPGSRNGFRNAPDTNERKSYVIDLNKSTSIPNPPETISRYGASTMGRTRNTSVEAGLHASQGLKRAPDGENKFLRSKPVRRGFRRRDSDDNVSPIDDLQQGSSSQPSAGTFTPRERDQYQYGAPRSRSRSVNGRATSVEPVSVQDFARQNNANSQGSRPPSRQAGVPITKSTTGSDSRPSSRQGGRDFMHSRQASVERPQYRVSTRIQPESGAAIESAVPQRRPSIDAGQARQTIEEKLPSRISSLNRSSYQYAAPQLQHRIVDDQENIPPPTFKRNKDQEFRQLGKPSLMALSDDEKPHRRTVDETPVPVPAQEQRRPLGAITGNTPHRVAPAPPPKMTVLDAATTTAGASTTKSRKKRQHMVVNGKIYTQMGKLGKGGSSEVYCVMAENYKTFALKRVKLTNCDESAVRGYKGEIDLLKKLTEVERVVRLFDWEMNEEKQELFLLMDKGELDLSRILTLQLNSGEASFDTTFTRFYWKEMLECVQAVHDHDIVHSDLKPANFLMVQGRLKLIDFGIANAIDTDNTCNVHRDSHVGTPNYMSPESINDTNASSTGRDEAGRPLKKDMRIGKASDVWSLGCILYQMAYGIPPFAHIKSQVSKIMAIVNPKHMIEYPEVGVGGAFIPLSLRSTLRRCLNRDPDRRPTVRQMLDGTDAFLNPEGLGAGSVLMSEELLGQIINKIIDRCKDPKRGVPTPEEAQAYPRSFMEKIRQIQEGR